jgi:hypothetical protein
MSIKYFLATISLLMQRTSGAFGSLRARIYRFHLGKAAAGAVVTRPVPRSAIIGRNSGQLAGMRWLGSEIIEHERLLAAQKII